MTHCFHFLNTITPNEEYLVLPVFTTPIVASGRMKVGSFSNKKRFLRTCVEVLCFVIGSYCSNQSIRQTFLTFKALLYFQQYFQWLLNSDFCCHCHCIPLIVLLLDKKTEKILIFKALWEPEKKTWCFNQHDFIGKCKQKKFRKI